MSVLPLLAVLPFVAILVVLAARDPLRILLPIYAATVPFGKGLALPGLPASFFSASTLSGLLLTVLLVGRLAFSRRWPVTVTAAPVVWLLFLALAGASIYWSFDAGQTSQEYLVLAGLIALYVVVRLSAVDAVTLRRVEWGILLGGAVTAVYGLYQYYTGTLLAGASGNLRFGRDLTDPNHLAATLLLPLAIALHRCVTASRWQVRLPTALLAASLLMAIVLTGSRGGVLGAVAVFIVLAVAGVRRARIAAVGVAAVGVLLVVSLLSPDAINDRLTQEGSSGRTGIWQVGLTACPDHCLTGSGWGTFGVIYEAYLAETPEAGALRGRQMGAHNNLLRVLVETGVAGLLLVLAGLGLAVREAAAVTRAHRGPPLAVVSALLLTGVLLGNIQFKYFWLVLIYVGIVHCVHANRSGASTAPLPYSDRRSPSDSLVQSPS